MGSDPAILVPAGRLKALSPLDRPFWIDQAVHSEEVWAAVHEMRLLDAPIAFHSPRWRDPGLHAQRVAYFVVHGLSDLDYVEIDVGAPELGCYVREPVQDGNHRLAGALLRGDAYVACSIAGSEGAIRRRFGRQVAEQLFSLDRAA